MSIEKMNWVYNTLLFLVIVTYVNAQSDSSSVYYYGYANKNRYVKGDTIYCRAVIKNIGSDTIGIIKNYGTLFEWRLVHSNGEEWTPYAYLGIPPDTVFLSPVDSLIAEWDAPIDQRMPVGLYYVLVKPWSSDYSFPYDTIFVNILAHPVKVTVTTDKSNYQVGEDIKVYITAHNPSSDSLTLRFASSCQSEYFIDDYYSVLNAAWGCYLGGTSVIIPPDSSLTWLKTHVSSDYYLKEGVHTVVGYVIKSEAGLSSPHFISIGDSISSPPTIGFYPAGDTIIIGNVYDVNVPGIQATYDTADIPIKKISFVTSAGRFEVKYFDWGGDGFPQAYFYMIDSMDTYEYTLSFMSENTAMELPLDSMVYIKDPFIVKLTLFNGNLPVDSLSQIFKPEYRLGIGDNYEIPWKFTLHQNFPNPFNPVTTIRYELPQFSHVRLSVYDILGREVAVLGNREEGPGVREVQWDASTVPSGVYFVQMRAGGFQQVRKVMVLK